MKQFSFLSILCFVLFSVSSVSSQTCINKGTFKPNSTYSTNLQLLLSSLLSNVTSQNTFFHNASIGQEPNRVYAIGMCIPGSTSDDCSACIKTASDGLLKTCPNQTDAFYWPGEPTLCLVRYSNTSFLGTVDRDPRVLLTNTGDLNYNLSEFKPLWEGLMGRMITSASTLSSSGSYYRADSVALTSIQNIYALMQCTPDISSGDCAYCLQQNAVDYQSCCGQKRGGVVMRPSCFLRWDLYRFSKAFDNLMVASPPPSVTVSVPKPGGEQINTTKSGKFFTIEKIRD